MAVCGVVVVSLLGIWVYQEIGFRQTYKELMSGNKIERMEMLVESPPKTNTQISIATDSVLTRINGSFRYLREFTPRSPKMHSVFIVVDIYKKRKCTVHLLKTTYNGWVVWIQDRWYQDDSLFSALDHFSILDSVK